MLIHIAQRRKDTRPLDGDYRQAYVPPMFHRSFVTAFQYRDGREMCCCRPISGDVSYIDLLPAMQSLFLFFCAVSASNFAPSDRQVGSSVRLLPASWRHLTGRLGNLRPAVALVGLPRDIPVFRDSCRFQCRPLAAANCNNCYLLFVRRRRCLVTGWTLTSRTVWTWHRTSLGLSKRRRISSDYV